MPSLKTIRQGLIWLFVLQLINVPIPFAHSHEGMGEQALAAHIQGFHAGIDESPISQGWHVHLFFLGSSTTDASCDEDDTPSGPTQRKNLPNNFPGGEFELKLLEMNSMNSVPATNDSTSLAVLRNSLEPLARHTTVNFGGTYSNPSQWRTLLAVLVI